MSILTWRVVGYIEFIRRFFTEVLMNYADIARALFFIALNDVVVGSEEVFKR